MPLDLLIFFESVLYYLSKIIINQNAPERGRSQAENCKLYFNKRVLTYLILQLKHGMSKVLNLLFFVDMSFLQL